MQSKYQTHAKHVNKEKKYTPYAQHLPNAYTKKHAQRMSSACQTHAKHVKKEKTHIKHT
jgi:chemotaxis response regulator CheB